MPCSGRPGPNTSRSPASHMEASSMSRIVGRSAMIGSILVGSRWPRILATSSVVANPRLAASVEWLCCIVFLSLAANANLIAASVAFPGMPLIGTTLWLGLRSMRRNAVGALRGRPSLSFRASAGKRSVDLVQHPLFLPHIARRKMKRLDAAHASLARDGSGRRSGQVRPLGGESRIRLRERRLNEQEIRISNEVDDGCAIGGRIGGVGHVRDFLAGRDSDHAAQGAKRHLMRMGGTRPGGNAERIVGGPA